MTAERLTRDPSYVGSNTRTKQGSHATIPPIRQDGAHRLAKRAALFRKSITTESRNLRFVTHDALGCTSHPVD